MSAGKIILVGWNAVLAFVVVVGALCYLPTHLVKHGPQKPELQAMYETCMYQVQSGNEQVCTNMIKAFKEQK